MHHESWCALSGGTGWSDACTCLPKEADFRAEVKRLSAALAAKDARIAELERLLGWIYHRSRFGLFQGRGERDSALSDINHAAQKFGSSWDGEAAKTDPNQQWMGEQP